MAKYYVLAKTLWQGSDWSPVAGPFKSKAEADAAAENLANDGRDDYGNVQLGSVVHTWVANATTMRREMKITTAQADEEITRIESERGFDEEMKRNMELYSDDFSY